MRLSVNEVRVFGHFNSKKCVNGSLRIRISLKSSGLKLGSRNNNVGLLRSLALFVMWWKSQSSTWTILGDAKIKEGLIAGQHICELFTDETFHWR